jgi:hypothetical protein
MRSRLSAFALAALLVAPAAHAQNPSVTVSVDAAANQRPISPLIYGVHFAGSAALLDLNATINRYGGNSSGRYNWVGNIDNRGGDYFFKSIPHFPRTSAAYMDGFVQATKDGAAEPFLTMPMVGSVAKDNGNNDLWSFSVNDCGPQSDALGDAGSGCVAGAKVESNDPCPNGFRKMTAPFLPACDPVNAASIAADHNFQQPWVQHIVGAFGLASAGGLKYWGLDNEPTIWHNAYWDVHPNGATTDEIRDKTFAYAAMIKSVDGAVKVLGPEEWGWDGYFYSGLDQQTLSRGNCGGDDCPDRMTHAAGDGNRDFVPYMLDRLKNYQDTHGGQRIVDVLSLHFYPTGPEYNFAGGNDVSDPTQLLRNRSTRALWDPAYVDEYWIAQPVRLIPRMHDWVNTYYPNTKIGLTEYNWGAEGHMNGATAEADLLGIFGREGLDMAIRWEVPAAGTPVYRAFKMYRNYDGAKSTFGDTSVSATSATNPDNVAAFAALRSSDTALTIMVISKYLSSDTPVMINLAGFEAAGVAHGWQLAANAINPIADIAFGGASFQATLPPQSITLFVVPRAAGMVASTTVVGSSANPSGCGQSVTFTATVTSAGGTPTGTVTFKDGAATLGGGTLSSGSAAFSTSALAAGSHSITAVYGGDSNFAGSTSPVLTQVVGSDSPSRTFVPDGRPAQGTIVAGTTLWFAIPTTIGNSYSVEVKNTTGTGVTLALTIFKGDDTCSAGSTLVTRDTSGVNPGHGSNGVRLAFSASGNNPVHKVRLVNASGVGVSYSVGVSDTTMFSPAWTTNGTFDTYWSFQNTTNAANTGQLTLFDLNGVLVQSLAVGPIPANAIFGTNTVALGVVRNRVGNVRFTHDGPPGAVVIKANQANFATSPPFIELVPFEAKRQIR